MIFLFAPALGSVAVILAIILREQFTFRRSVPMLDQIHAESATRLLAEKRHQTLGAKWVLTVQANRALVGLLECPDSVGPRDMRVKALDHLQMDVSSVVVDFPAGALHPDGRRMQKT